VFLAGKQEIIRCVNRLKQRLEPSDSGRKMGGTAVEKNEQSLGRNDVHRRPLDVDSDAVDSFRDMDDDEVDGDLFQKEEDEDDYDGLENDDDADIYLGISANDDGDKRPRKVLILPLHSMLSAVEQAKVLSPVPDDTRLIVVATNIAETSIAIPGGIYNCIMARRGTSLSLLIIIILRFNVQGISYLVDCGRRKCRNYHAGAGGASYDAMWISKGAADQRAGRAVWTGPGSLLPFTFEQCLLALLG
jgi:ATP-dependent RNA helicase DHX37/DHR1